MTRENEIVGCILAGGMSSRMGRDKSLLMFGGVSLIERAAALLHGLFATVVVASDRTDAYKFLALPILPDVRKGCGPLGGIHGALTQTRARHLFVLACDMPFVSPDLIRYILGMKTETNAVVPTMDGRIHPLCGLYSRTGFTTIERSLDRGEYKLNNVLNELKPVIVPVTPDLPFYSPHLLDNLNDRNDVELARRLADNNDWPIGQHSCST